MPCERPVSPTATSSDIVEVIAYYAYANRIADGLGVETESWIPD